MFDTLRFVRVPFYIGRKTLIANKTFRGKVQPAEGLIFTNKILMHQP